VAADLTSEVRLSKVARRMLLLAALWSIVANLGFLIASAQVRAHEVAVQNAELRVAEVLRNAPALKRGVKIDPALMPPVTTDLYLLAIDAYGSPTSSVPLKQLPTDPVNQTALRLLGSPRIDIQRATASALAACPWPVSPGRQLTVTSNLAVTLTGPGRLSLFAWIEGPQPAVPIATYELGDAARAMLWVPDSAGAAPWHVAIQTKNALMNACTAPSGS